MPNSIKIDETINAETKVTTPITPVRKFLNLSNQYKHTNQHVQQCKQRQIELERAVNKLIEVLMRKISNDIDQILQYWKQIKQILLERFQLKTNRFQLTDYLLKYCCSISNCRKQIELYIEKNDEIKAYMDIGINNNVHYSKSNNHY